MIFKTETKPVQPVANENSVLVPALNSNEGDPFALDLSRVDPNLHELACEVVDERDAFGFVGLVPYQNRIRLINDNLLFLLEAGMYENALHYACLLGPRLPQKEWLYYFCFADRERLAACGDVPLPIAPVKLYRGICNPKHRRFIRNVSWTTDPGVASWYAQRHAGPHDNPTVYSTIAKPEHVLCMTNEREETDVVIESWRCGRMTRLKALPESHRPIE